MAQTLIELIDTYPTDGDPHVFRRFYDAMTARLDEFSAPFPIIDEASYRTADRIRKHLGSLWCSHFNRDADRALVDRVCGYENSWCRAVSDYNRSQELKEGPSKLLALYLTSRKRFAAIDARASFVLAARAGVLRKVVSTHHGRVTLYVIGLRRKVRDNCSQRDRRGREYLVFTRTIGRQAIEVLHPLPWTVSEAPVFLAGVPALDDSFYETHCGDWKNGANASSIRRGSRQELFDLLAAVPAIDLNPVSPAVLPAPAVGPLPTQQDLFGNGLALAA